MGENVTRSGRLALGLALAAGALAIAVVVGASWLDRDGRSRGPEAVVLAYAVALGRGDLAGALAQLAPEGRARAAPFVEHQLGNRYTILDSVVRSAPILDRLTGKATADPVVVMSLEIQEEAARWRTVDEIPVRLIDGRWYLLRPPLEPGG